MTPDFREINELLLSQPRQQTDGLSQDSAGPVNVPEDTQIDKKFENMTSADHSDNSINLQIPTSNDYENVTIDQVFHEKENKNNESSDEEPESRIFLNNNRQGNAEGDNTLTNIVMNENTTNIVINEDTTNIGINEDTSNNTDIFDTKNTPFKHPDLSDIISEDSNKKPKRNSLGLFFSKNTSSSPWLKHVKDPFASDSPAKSHENGKDSENGERGNAHEIFARLRNEDQNVFPYSQIETQNAIIQIEGQKLITSLPFNDDTQKIGFDSQRTGFDSNRLCFTQKLDLNTQKSNLDTQKLDLDTQKVDFNTQKSFLRFGSDPTQKIVSQFTPINFSPETQKVDLSAQYGSLQRSTQVLPSQFNINNIRSFFDTPENVVAQGKEEDFYNAETQKLFSQPTPNATSQKQPYEVLGSLKRLIFVSQSSENDEKEADLQIPGTLDVTNQEVKNIAGARSRVGPRGSSQASTDKIASLNRNILGDNDGNMLKNAIPAIEPGTLLAQSSPVKLDKGNVLNDKNEMAKNFVELKHSPFLNVQESSPAIRDHVDILNLDSPTRKLLKNSPKFSGDNPENSDVEDAIYSSPIKNTYNDKPKVSKTKSVELVDVRRSTSGNVDDAKAQVSKEDVVISSAEEETLKVKQGGEPKRNNRIIDDSEDDVSGSADVSEKQVNNPQQALVKPEKFIREETEGANVKGNTSSVWAAYDFKYYPAVILNQVNNQYNVQFFDISTFLNQSDIMSVLEVSVGDIVKLHFKRETFIVTALQNDSRSESDISCIRGYNTVYLKRFVRNTVSDKYPEICVSLWDIYMTEASWQKKNKAKHKIVEKGQDTPSISVNSTFRKKGKPIALPPQSREDQFLSLISSPDVSPIKPKVKSNIFQNSAFCLTGEHEEDRVRLTNLIIENGGIVLKEGFETLLQIVRDQDDNIVGVEVMGQFENIKFAAVIAKSFSRSQKYLQGLALGWPVLSLNFIVDCVQNSIWLDNWTSYTLAAGESKVLGCIQSCDISHFRENYADIGHSSLSNQLKNNSHVFKNHVVLMINKRPSVCEFLFHVLGIKEIKHVTGYNEEIFDIVKQLHDKNKVKPVRFLLYDNIKLDEIYERLSTLSETSDSELISTKSRKRARTEIGTISTRDRSGIFKRNNFKKSFKKRTFNTRKQNNCITLELVDWEWVVQCIISSNCWPTKKRFVIDF